MSPSARRKIHRAIKRSDAPYSEAKSLRMADLGVQSMTSGDYREKSKPALTEKKRLVPTRIVISGSLDFELYLLLRGRFYIVDF